MKKILCYFLFITCIYAFDPCLIVVGPPGSGKGNFSQFFMTNYGYNHISAGDLLRHEVEMGTEIGKRIEPILKEGKPIDPNIMKQILKSKIEQVSKSETSKRLIIDGYGGQDAGDIEYLSTILKELGLFDQTVAIFFEAEDEICIERMQSRLVCRDCGYVHNTVTMPPKVEGCCNNCSSTLIRRPQDESDVILKRMNHYKKNMEPNYLNAKYFFPFIKIKTNDTIETCVKIFESFNLKISGSENRDEFMENVAQ